MEISLPDEAGRVQILKIHTTKMRSYDKLAPDVDLKELATLSKNFSGAEIEGLVRAAQSSAMNRLIKASSKVQIDPDAVDKLMVNRDDFMYALEHDVKPAFGLAEEALDHYLTGGIIVWGPPVRSVLDDGDLLVQQAKSPDTRGLVSVLIEGPPNSGKTALAATIAKNSEFPFIRVCTPEDMVGYTETAKCNMLRKVFDDAYKSPFSVILVDNIERLLVLLKKQPPPKKRLLILVTSSVKSVLDDLEVVPAFSTVVHVSPLTTGEHILQVLEQVDPFSKDEMQSLQRKLPGKRCLVGVKKLLDLIDLVKQSSEKERIPKFLCKLEEEGGLEPTY